MKKILRSSIFRAICAIATGILLVNNPDSTVVGITIAIGVMFLISGVISCATYLNARKSVKDTEVYDSQGRLIMQARPPFPIVGIGSILLGLILTIVPDMFITSLMYILGALIILGATSQFMTLIGATKMFHVPIFFWIGPSIVLITGVFVIIKPMESAALPLLIIGWCLLFYGATECVNSIKIYKETRKFREITK